MSDLAALQRTFYAYLRGGPIAPLAARVIDRGAAAISVRLGIYANAYHKRLAEALEADHAILGRYLGDTLWQRLCTDYIAEHPSQTRSLRWYGDALPQFLTVNEPFAQHPLVAELAGFERALLATFDAADADPLPWSAMQTVAAEHWPGLRLHFHPSVCRHCGAWNAVAVWQALTAGREPPAAQAQAAGVWLLWRDRQRITQFRAVADDEHAALTAMADQGADFAVMCERLSEYLPPAQVPARALALLESWFNDGLITALAPSNVER